MYINQNQFSLIIFLSDKKKKNNLWAKCRNHSKSGAVIKIEHELMGGGETSFVR